MITAKEQILTELKETGADNFVRCADLKYWPRNGEPKDFRLPLNYSAEQWVNFLSALDFELPKRSGIPEFFGTVWLKKGWLSLDGYAEYGWEWHIEPEIPPHILD